MKLVQFVITQFPGVIVLAFFVCNIRWSIDSASIHQPTKDDEEKSSNLYSVRRLRSRRRLRRVPILSVLSGVRLRPLGTTATTGLLYQPQMIDDGDCGAFGGIKIGRGNVSTWKKYAPAPLCLPQILHDQTRARTRAAELGSQRLVA
jgi:hypothetical protein